MRMSLQSQLRPTPQTGTWTGNPISKQLVQRCKNVRNKGKFETDLKGYHGAASPVL